MLSFKEYATEYGWKYKTEEAMRAAYNRAEKASQKVMWTEDDFIEAATTCNTNPETLSKVYAKLVKLVEEKKLSVTDIYQYAGYYWCVKNPKAIVAYKVERNKWEVNNCDSEIFIEKAIFEVNREWGFEASRIKIVGTPYYESTDWQFIRFNCAHMTWLWKNGNLYQVYE